MAGRSRRSKKGAVGRVVQRLLITIAAVAFVSAFLADRLNIDLAGLARDLPGGRDANVSSDAPDGPSEITIASWNIRMLTDGSRNADEVAKIAETMSQFDLVAVQEARDTRILDRILDELPGWEYVASEPVGRGVAEIYAFFWRTSPVEPIGRPHLVGDPDDEFIREPYAATFRAGEFDFTLCTIHLLFGNSESERRRELRLMDEAVEAVQAANGAEQDVILLGDFNFPPTDRGWELDGWKPLFRPPMKTTIGDRSLYDNMWIAARHTGEYADECGMVCFDRERSRGDLRAASLEMSDHRPIWAAFRTGADDDADEYGSLADATVKAGRPVLP